MAWGTEMRAIVDLVDSVAGTWTRTVGMLVIGGIVIAGLFMLMVSFTAPAVVEHVGERAERISDKAIEAAREEARAHAMAEDGWGYSDSAASADTHAADTFDDTSSDYNASSSHDSGSEYVDDWGAGAE